MQWEGREESTNVEDQRGLSGGAGLPTKQFLLSLEDRLRKAA